MPETIAGICNGARKTEVIANFNLKLLRTKPRAAGIAMRAAMKVATAATRRLRARASNCSVGIFEYHYMKRKPLPIVKPGTQTRRFTHISDTIDVCYEAFKKNKCKYYSITNRNSYSIIDVAKMFKSKFVFLKPRSGERYASALTKMSNNYKIIQKYGKFQLKDYISSFIKA